MKKVSTQFKHSCIIAIALFALAMPNYAQIKIDLKGKLEREADQRANENTDKAVDKTFDSIEEGFGSMFKKKDKNKSTEEPSSEDQAQQQAETEGGEALAEASAPKNPELKWSSFDFVPGDEVIFEDAPSFMEENGEFPSRWDLLGGQAEIAEVDGQTVIYLIDGSPTIMPYLKDAHEDYLPDVFTIEFDFYKSPGSNRISVYLYDRKNQREGDNLDIEVSCNRADVGSIVGYLPEEHDNEVGRWIRVSIAYTKGKLKLYMDETRVINIPRYEGNPTGFTFQSYFADAQHPTFLKDVRIAKGGVKYYDRVMQDGKIVCNGIRFDVNKATLKPESMGPINKIYKLMQKDPNLKFSVEGHTDGDGDEASNQKLSENRAKAVMDQLIEMGISADRLEYKGFGESVPVASNGTAEGKANNRRVEFVKI